MGDTYNQKIKFHSKMKGTLQNEITEKRLEKTLLDNK